MLTHPANLRDHLAALRGRVVMLMNAAFLTYAVVTTLLSPVPITADALLNGPHMHRTWAALLVGLGTLALWRWPRQVRTVYVPYLLMLSLLSILEVRSLRVTNTAPFHLALWLTGNMAVLPLIFGSRTGAKLAAGMIAGILVGLISPQADAMGLDGYALADWATTLIVMAAAAASSTMLMQIIENYLNAHERTAQALADARVDTVTGLPNRAISEARLGAAVQEAHLHGTPLSVLLLDLDHFKAVNDEHGHPAGDRVLRACAERLAAHVDVPHGLVGRWGGEEFIVVLPGLPEPEARRLGERLREVVAATPICDLPLTTSVGGTTLQRGPLHPAAPPDLHAQVRENLVRAADLALYQAKRSGRDRVCFLPLNPA